MKVKSVLVLVLALVHSLLPVALGESATLPVDFGHDAMYVYSACSACANKLGFELDTNTISYDASASEMIFSFDKLRVSVHINPITKFADSFRIMFFRYYDFEDYAYDIGYTYGVLCNVLTGSKDNVAQKLGIDSSFSLDEKLQSSFADNGYIYSLVVDPDEVYSFSLAINCANRSSANIPLDASMIILKKMQSHIGINISASFLYDKNNDLNGVFGKDGHYVSKLNFAIRDIAPDAISVPELSIEQGGAIEVFEFENDAIARYDKIQEFGYFVPQDSNFLLRYKNVLLRLSTTLTPELLSVYIGAFLASMEV